MADEPRCIGCEVVYARPERQFVIPLKLPPGTTAREALLRSGLLERCPEIVLESVTVGIYGRVVSVEYAVQDGDRVEVYRPLTCDPRTARRERVKIADKTARRR